MQGLDLVSRKKTHTYYLWPLTRFLIPIVQCGSLKQKQCLVFGTHVKNSQAVLKHVPRHSLQPFLLFVAKTIQFVQRVVQFGSALKHRDNAGAAITQSWDSWNGGTPKTGWFTVESPNLIWMMTGGYPMVPPFQETSLL